MSDRATDDAPVFQLFEPHGDQAVQPRVSIVIPAFNEEKEICALLKEMGAQTCKSQEIIVVDDGSTDGTSKAASECTKRWPNVRIVRTEHRGVSHARNTGVRESRGDIVFFAECDCVYDDTYVEKALRRMDEAPEASAVCLTGAPLVLRSTLATECIELENMIQHKLLKEGKMKPFYAWVFRKEVLEKLGGYDEKLSQAEDKDLFGRLVSSGRTVEWIPGIHWRHKRDQTMGDIARKSFLRGRNRILYTLKHRLMGELAKNMLPLWATLFGAVLAVFYPVVGALIILLVLATVLVRSLRVTAASWSLVQRRRVYLEYPVFLLIRNFSTGLGYSVGLVRIIASSVRGSRAGES